MPLLGLTTAAHTHTHIHGATAKNLPRTLRLQQTPYMYVHSSVRPSAIALHHTQLVQIKLLTVAVLLYCIYGIYMYICVRGTLMLLLQHHLLQSLCRLPHNAITCDALSLLLIRTHVHTHTYADTLSHTPAQTN